MLFHISAGLHVHAYFIIANFTPTLFLIDSKLIECKFLPCIANSPLEMWKSMLWRHYEVFWLIHHLWAILNQNQPGARLAPLRNFFRGEKQNGHHRLSINSVLGYIFTSNALTNTILVSTTMFSWSRNPIMIKLKVYIYKTCLIFSRWPPF